MNKLKDLRISKMKFGVTGISFFVFSTCLSMSSGNNLRVKRGSGGRGISLSPTVILEILDKHNQLRASVSSSDMRRLTWDDELTVIAQDYGKKCQFSHNTEGSHSKFQTSIGENIYASTGSYERFSASNAIQLWFNEKSDFNYVSRTCRAGKKCGHYTQVVWSDTYKIGCSLTTCDDVTEFSSSTSHLFICNYSPAGNVYTIQSDGSRQMQNPFLQGPPCTACKNTSDTCSKQLCSNSYRAQSILYLAPDSSENAYDNTGLVVAVVLLSIAFTTLLLYNIFETKLKAAFNNWMGKGGHDNHARFSNQNTPHSSKTNTPRTSIVTTNLHGLPRSQNNERKSSLTPSSLLANKTAKPPRPVGPETRHFLDVKSQQPTNSPNKPLRPPPVQYRPH